MSVEVSTEIMDYPDHLDREIKKLNQEIDDMVRWDVAKTTVESEYDAWMDNEDEFPNEKKPAPEFIPREILKQRVLHLFGITDAEETWPLESEEETWPLESEEEKKVVKEKKKKVVKPSLSPLDILKQSVLAHFNDPKIVKSEPNAKGIAWETLNKTYSYSSCRKGKKTSIRIVSGGVTILEFIV
jgi:hypothetical protein